MSIHPTHAAGSQTAGLQSPASQGIWRSEIVAQLKRFDRPGPRYTSYPTAIEFAPEVGLEHALGKLLEADALGDAPLSVYVHLIFMFELFGIARERFLKAGYVPIGMDHFAKADDELTLARAEGRLRRNFQGYAVVPSDDVLGLGLSAIGDVRGSLLQNAKKLSHYGRAIRAGRLPIERGVARTREDVLHGEVIHELMCNGRIDCKAFEERHAIVFKDFFREDLAQLQEVAQQGLVTIQNDAIQATQTGELFLRNLAICFDTYWRTKHAHSKKPLFSRTI